MFPTINIFGRVIGTYALVAVIGALICGFFFCRMIRKRGLNDNQAIAFLLWIAVGVLIGSHLLYAVVNLPYLSLEIELNGVFKALINLFGGSVFYGGLIGGLVAGLISIKVMKADLLTYSYCIAPIIPLFHAFARVGCFMGGCCYGVISEFGFVVRNNPYVPLINNVSRFPVQLLESALNLVLAFVLFYLVKKSEKGTKLKKMMLRIYLMSYACIRFITEFFRGDEHRGFVGPLSTSQFISVIIFIICLATIALPKVIKNKKVSD